MTVGTKSVLFGAHQFLIHPWFVAAAWWQIYGFPWDPRLWIAFFVHDIGYIGKPNMDGPEGETHVELGARIMGLFGRRWHYFALLHSRYYAKKAGLPYSRLCVADKLAIAITPAWLYLPMVKATGEIQEYLHKARNAESAHWKALHDGDAEIWHTQLCVYMRQWVAEHRDGRADSWTNGQRNVVNDAGVWQ